MVFLWIALFAVIAALVNAAGIVALYFNWGLVIRLKEYFLCFAAGVLISVPLMFAFPEAVEMNQYAGFSALAGFLFMLFSKQLVRTWSKEKTFGIVAAEGIGIHSFVDGAIYAVTFSSSIFIGLISGIGLVVHEFAEGVIIFSILIKGGFGRRKAAVYALFIASLTTPVGAFIAYPVVSVLTEELLGMALGFVVGVLIYLSAAHLLPEAKGGKHSILAFISGVLLALIIVATEILG